MKISQIRTAIAKQVRNYKIEKERKFINKYVKVHPEGINSEVLTQLSDGVKKGLANHAKAEGVTIEISKAQDKVGNLLIAVQKKDNKYIYSYERCIPADTTSTYINTQGSIKFVDKNGNKRNYSQLEYHEVFLKHLYRTISDLIKRIQK